MALLARLPSLLVLVVLQVAAMRRLQRVVRRAQMLLEVLFRLLQVTAPLVVASSCLAVLVQPTLVDRCASVLVSAVAAALVVILLCLQATRRAMSRPVDLCVPLLVTAMLVEASRFVRAKVPMVTAVAWLSRRVPAPRLQAAVSRSAQRLVAVLVVAAACS